MVETLTILAVVGLAGSYLGSRVWRTARAARRTEPGCGSNCGCSE
jgi:hypothetical protein